MAEQRREEVIVIKKDIIGFDDDLNLVGNASGDIIGSEVRNQLVDVDDLLPGLEENTTADGSSGIDQASGILEGRDANRLDYFGVTPVDVHYGDDDLTGGARQASSGISYNNTIASNDGSGGGGDVVSIKKHSSGFDVNGNDAAKTFDQESIKRLKELSNLQLGILSDLELGVGGMTDNDYLIRGAGYRSSSKNVEPQQLDFGGDANRLDFFNVTPFDVKYEDNDYLTRVASYGGGGGGDRAIQPSSNIRDIDATRHQRLMEQKSVTAAARSFPVRSFVTNGSGLSYRGRSIGAEAFVQELNHETANVGFGSRAQILNRETTNEYGGGDTMTREVSAHGGGSEREIDEEEEGFMITRWWTKCWLLLALWKIV